MGKKVIWSPGKRKLGLVTLIFLFLLVILLVFLSAFYPNIGLWIITVIAFVFFFILFIVLRIRFENPFKDSKDYYSTQGLFLKDQVSLVESELLSINDSITRKTARNVIDQISEELIDCGYKMEKKYDQLPTIINRSSLDVIEETNHKFIVYIYQTLYLPKGINYFIIYYGPKRDDNDKILKNIVAPILDKVICDFEIDSVDSINKDEKKKGA